MFTPKHTVVAAVFALSACASQPVSTGKAPAFGAPVSADEVARFDISIPPSGTGLPSGSGTARQGAKVYEQKCLACHGAKGAGKPADPLAGGMGTLASNMPLVKMPNRDGFISDWPPQSRN